MVAVNARFKCRKHGYDSLLNDEFKVGGNGTVNDQEPHKRSTYEMKVNRLLLPNH